MRVLMVSSEYPPMKGGIGRYTSNLTRALQNCDLEMHVLCDDKGNGNFSGISPANEQNSQILLKVTNDLKPDIVHIQFDPGLYGLRLDIANPAKSGTYIDLFYQTCRIPIITTFHSAYTLKEWMKTAVLTKKFGRTGRLGIPARLAIRAWKRFLNYRSFHNINKEKLALSRAGIVFSRYMYELMQGGEIIYHGAEPGLSINPGKNEARDFFSLFQESKEEKGSKNYRIALALGFETATKGWDILEKIHIPDGWVMIVNSSKGYYNAESFEMKWNRSSSNNIIDLKRGFLTDEELSLLFYASDAVILPYSVTSGSGVMFDALAHGLPFVATDLEFFREFSALNLGITVKRNPARFSKALQDLDDNYSSYIEAVCHFKERLKWDHIAREHLKIYKKAM
jgi:glycosyltransferase involved in cell wall biosynthesis